MKIKLFILFVLICVNSWLHSTTWYIKQDGTGNFTTIQEGIIAATNSDTILVYPATYYENIDYLEKSLTIASLYIITPEDSLINQTIIDGNQEFRCVTIDDCDDVSLIGFTIQNGLAYVGLSQGQYGGGIYLRDTSYSLISHCKIKYNKAYSGGGLHINHGNTILENNTISNNWGVRFGGGISIYGYDTNIQFSETNLNNIYFNYSSTGSDIGITEIVPPLVINVDTLTVSEPDYFFIIPTFKYTFYGLNAKIEQIDQDLFVSPDGNNNNSGLTPEEPLKTISWAQTLIKRNDENPNTIHLAPGIFSPSLNDQRYPLNVKHGVTYQGFSSEETILDAEGQSPIFRIFSLEDMFISLLLNNLKLTNGHGLPLTTVGAIDLYQQANLVMNNVIIENCFGETGSAIRSSDGFYSFNNIIAKNNSGGHAISLTANHQNQNPVLDVEIINGIIKNNDPGQGQDNGSGGGLILYGHSNISGDFNAKLINCEIRGNDNNFYNPQTGLGGAVGLYIGDNLNADIVNCTLGDNSLTYDTGCVISVLGAELNLYNSILYNNDGYSFIIWNEEEVNISHSLIESGDSNVFYYSTGAINWHEGNLDEDPLWTGTGDYPYYLQNTSPCIEAGTLDFPTSIVLPEFDLAGNPRIYGETIDMGAYEWQGVEVEEDETVPITQTEIFNYPNPFNPSTTIKLDLAESGKIELAIYNIKGQKVKTLMDAYSCKGNFEIIWRGTDDNKRSVASGNYFIKLIVNGKEKSVSKCVLLK